MAQPSSFYYAELAVGQHWYWTIGSQQLHGQVVITTWVVFAFILASAAFVRYQLREKPSELQNLAEYLVEFIRDIANTQIGESESRNWTPFLGTLFLFIYVSNWSGAMLPWGLLVLPNGELAAPTNDINTTTALAILVSTAYFSGGIAKSGIYYFRRYVAPEAFLLPINVLEDFTKPLSLRFRLFGNILADELVVGVLVILAPLLIPVPLMLLGLFTSAIQALVFATLAGAYIGEVIEGSTRDN
jgi:F-type H+-transporting ATPase subunit a